MRESCIMKEIEHVYQRRSDDELHEGNSKAFWYRPINKQSITSLFSKTAQPAVGSVALHQLSLTKPKKLPWSMNSLHFSLAIYYTFLFQSLQGILLNFYWKLHCTNVQEMQPECRKWLHRMQAAIIYQCWWYGELPALLKVFHEMLKNSPAKARLTLQTFSLVQALLCQNHNPPVSKSSQIAFGFVTYKQTGWKSFTSVLLRCLFANYS